MRVSKLEVKLAFNAVVGKWLTRTRVHLATLWYSTRLLKALWVGFGDWRWFVIVGFWVRPLYNVCPKNNVMPKASFHRAIPTPDTITWLFVCRPLIKISVRQRKCQRCHFGKIKQNYRKSCVLSTDRIEIHQSQPIVWRSDILYVMLAGCDWWISIRSVYNMYDWRKCWKCFHGCFVFESRVSTKTVIIHIKRSCLIPSVAPPKHLSHGMRFYECILFVRL